MQEGKIFDICSGISIQSEKLFALAWIYTIKNSRMIAKVLISFLTLQRGNAVLDAPRPIPDARMAHICDAERHDRHSHAEREER
ncbi:DUF1534 domain-containing protein [Pseudomonas syringae pv. maculicola str. ES4326]|uniref:DUF1534 domain-containing protein n=1 Tax=Pseudomonas syringae pv. maculicola str. ES4326 TaxID=629265 RepID=A0A8T8BVB1_PSEYM|nr:DUF1534 domain-containing protein [Pseudomonas syringae pv. maculicola str. ES4326]